MPVSSLRRCPRVDCDAVDARGVHEIVPDLGNLPFVGEISGVDGDAVAFVIDGKVLGQGTVFGYRTHRRVREPGRRYNIKE